jgi:glucose-1-phosphate adenylyltransferase
MTQRPNPTPVFILAGGVGERLNPLTETKPKPAVSFGATHQIIDFTLSNCINSGLRKIFVLTQYQREHLQDYIRESRVRMSHSFRWHEGDQLLSVPPVSGKRYRGTADAVFQNLPLIRFDTADHVLIASGDHIYSMDYRPLLWRHSMSGADMTIAAVRRPVTEASAFGVLDVSDGMVTGFREKPCRASLPESGDVLVSMGVYVFSRKALLDIADRATPMETDFGRDIVPRLIRGHKIAAYDFGNSPRNYWRDVGSLDSYFEANMDLLGSRPEFDLDPNSEWPMFTAGDPSAVKTGGSRVSRRAVIATRRIKHSVVSHGACIESGTLIENSVILPGARVGKNVQLRNAIVAEGATVPDGCSVGMNRNTDQSRFMVTPGGVVVVNATSRRLSLSPLHEVARHAVGAA